MTGLRILFTFFCMLAVTPLAHAASTSLEGGVGVGDDSNMAYVLQVRQTYDPLASGELGALTPFAELGATLWAGHNDTDWGAFLAPGLMFTLGTSSIFEPFLAASVGGAVLTEDEFDSRELGSHLLFRSKGAVGVRFGDGLRHRIQGEYTNYSTWGLTDTDEGFSTYGLSYGYAF